MPITKFKDETSIRAQFEIPTELHKFYRKLLIDTGLTQSEIINTLLYALEDGKIEIQPRDDYKKRKKRADLIEIKDARKYYEQKLKFNV